MTMRTKGDLCGLTVRTETEYGKVSAQSSAYGGTLLTLDTPDDVTVGQVMQCGSQVRGDVYREAMSPSYTAKFSMVRGHGWESWAEKALGALAGVRSVLPSYSTVFRVASDESHLMTGCRVTTLGISAGNVGEKIEFNVKAMCRWHTVTPFADSDGSSLTMDSAAIPKGAPVTYSKPWEWSTDGVSFTPIRGKGFALTVERALVGDPGASKDDGTGFRLDAGLDSVPTDASIRLDITVSSTGPEWDRLRLAFTTGITVRTVIDGKTVTLTGCYLDPAMPSRLQGPYDETVGFSAADMSVA